MSFARCQGLPYILAFNMWNVRRYCSCKRGEHFYILDRLVKRKLRIQTALCQARSLFCILRVTVALCLSVCLSECNSENRWMNFREFMYLSKCWWSICVKTHLHFCVRLWSDSLNIYRRGKCIWCNVVRKSEAHIFKSSYLLLSRLIVCV